MEYNKEFQEKVKNSFLKVKEEINSIKKEVENIRLELSNQKKINLELKSKIDKILTFLNNNMSNFLPNYEKYLKSSTGNGGVNDNQRQSTTMIDNAQKRPLMVDLKRLFNRLTDREFSVFIAIYKLEEETGLVTYTDVARLLKIRETTIRDYVTELINRGFPVVRERYFNQKVSLYIKKDFRNLQIADKLLKIRESKSKQTFLVDDY